MRMRRKKHREERLEACSEFFIENLSDYSDNLRKIFPNDNPLHIEIGCGKGGFTVEMARRNPDINFLAIERNLDVLVIASEKVKEAGVTNVRFAPGDAAKLSEFPEFAHCDRLYINFCDPWKKSRHAKRRLTHANFLQIWERILSDEGEIHFKTDNMKLFEFSLNSFCAYGMKLKNISLDLHNSDFEGNVMTEYEKLFSEKGQPIYRLEAKKNR